MSEEPVFETIFEIVGPEEDIVGPEEDIVDPLEVLFNGSDNMYKAHLKESKTSSVKASILFDMEEKKDEDE